MMSSTFSLSAGSLFLLSLAAPATASHYGLVETWQGEHFLDYFNFHVGSDPTNGYVNYLSQKDAESSGLVKITDSGSVYLGVDHEATLDPNGKGRDSVRIGTKKFYDKSLVIADIAHMPGSACGTWPAFWSVGQNWPQDGEIDIIEGVNLQDHNEIVMHTGGTCSLSDQGMTGAVNATGCGEALGTVGCVIEGDNEGYGTNFNKKGGGVYAMEWTNEYLKIYFFPRASIPASITRGEPDTSEFGQPLALVQEGCDVANSFKAQSFIFDVTFCGDWAGGVFGESGCPLTSGDSFQSCTNYVAKHPSAFEQSYWEINSVKVYEQGARSIPPHPTHSSVISATHISSETSVAETRPSEVPHTTTSKAAPIKETTTAEPEVEETTTPAAAEPLTITNSGKTITVDTTSTVRSTRSATHHVVTEVVTALTTLCSESETAAAEPTSAPAAHVQTLMASANTAASSAAHYEPPTSWQTLDNAGSSPELHSLSHAEPIPTSAAPIHAPAPSQASEVPEDSGARPSTKPVQAQASNIPSSVSHVIPAPASSNVPQTSKPLIPVPTVGVLLLLLEVNTDLHLAAALRQLAPSSLERRDVSMPTLACLLLQWASLR